MGASPPAPGDGAADSALQRQQGADQEIQGEEASTPEGRTRQALRLAQAALAEAQEAAENLHTLPSAREPSQAWRQAGQVAKPLGYAALCAGVWASHAGGLAYQVPVALLTGAVMGAGGLRRGSLSLSGALAAAALGGCTLAASLRCGGTLLAFFFASSKLTRYAEERKDLDEAFKPGGQRDWKQVFANALVPAMITIALARQTGGADVLLHTRALRTATALLGGFLGYYACCCGDTWGSEVGQLSQTEPRLITSLRPVRPGTNGGVTPLGLAASAAGGLFVGTVFCIGGLAAPRLTATAGAPGWPAAALQWQLIPLGLVAGLVGSLLDSLLGATVQFTGVNRASGKLTSKYSSEVVPLNGIPLLSNNAVNLVSASVVAALTSRAALLLF